jgi:hypothetical protein
VPYQWNNLVQEWLLNQNLDYEPEEIVDAFNQVEKTMGSSWIGLTFGTTRGIWNAISIIELGKMLVDVEKTPNGSKLINKIKENYPNSIQQGAAGRKIGPSQFKASDSLHELSHSLQVARLIARYRRHSCVVEIEPELIVNGRRRFPDLRVLHDSDSNWTYVEVVCPGFSKETQEIYETLNRISTLEDQIMDRVIEVYLYRDPTELDIRQIIDTCKLLAQKDLQPQESNLRGIAQIFTNPWNEELLPSFGPAITEKRPVLVCVSFEIKTEEGLSHGRRCIAKMPFTDERAQRILGEKSGQLSRTEPGLIVLDVSSIPGGFKRWPELVTRRLQPNLNRRIGAVLVTANSITNKKMVVQNSLIKHPNPLHQLSDNFLTVTSSCS